MKKKGQSGKHRERDSQDSGKKGADANPVRASTAEDFGPDVIRPRWWPARPLEEGTRSPDNRGEEGQRYVP